MPSPKPTPPRPPRANGRRRPQPKPADLEAHPSAWSGMDPEAAALAAQLRDQEETPPTPPAGSVDGGNEAPVFESTPHGTPTTDDASTPATEAQLAGIAQIIAIVFAILGRILHQLRTPGPNEVWFPSADDQAAVALPASRLIARHTTVRLEGAEDAGDVAQLAGGLLGYGMRSAEEEAGLKAAARTMAAPQ